MPSPEAFTAYVVPGANGPVLVHDPLPSAMAPASGVPSAAFTTATSVRVPSVADTLIGASRRTPVLPVTGLMASVTGTAVVVTIRLPTGPRSSLTAEGVPDELHAETMARVATASTSRARRRCMSRSMTSHCGPDPGTSTLRFPGGALGTPREQWGMHPVCGLSTAAILAVMSASRWFPPPSPSRCPDCSGPVSDRRCAACGLNLEGQAAATLWWLDRELHRLSDQRAAVLSQLRAASRGAARPAPTPPFGVGAPTTLAPSHSGGATVGQPIRAERPEASSRDLQNLLLGLGAFLLAVASVVFATVTWTRLSAGVQGLVLGGLTAGAATGAAALHRRGLKATAEAVAAVSVFLALIDIHAVRISAVPGVEPLIYWSGGLAVLAVGAALFGRVAKVVVVPVCTAIAIQLCIPFLLLGNHVAPSLLALGLLLQAGVAVTLLAVVGPTRTGTTRFLVGFGAATAWFVGTGTTVGALDPSVSWTLPGLLLLSAAVAAVVAGWWDDGRELAVGAAAALSLGAIGVVIGRLASGDVLVLALGALSAAGLAAAGGLGRRHVVDVRWLRAPALVGSVVAVASLAPLVQPAAEALVGRIGQLDHVWNGDLADHVRATVLRDQLWAGSAVSTWYLLLFGGVLAALVAARRWIPFGPSARPRPLPISGTAPARNPTDTAPLGGAAALWLAVALPMVPLLVDAPAFATVAWLLAWSAVSVSALALRPQSKLVVLPAWSTAGVCASVAMTWALVDPWSTVTALAVLTVLSAVATLAAPPRRLVLPVGTVTTAVLAAAIVPTVQLALGASPTAAWFGVTITAIVLSAGAWLLELGTAPDRSGHGLAMLDTVGRLVEVTAATLATVGLLGIVDTGSADQISVALALVTTAVAAHSARPSRRLLIPVAVLGALALIWQRLALGQVTTVEAYSLPAAAALLAAGLWYRRRAASSWEWSGPALAAAFGPTTLVALNDPGLTRTVGALVAAAAVVIVGARRRLIAPAWIGTAVLVAVGVRHLGPVVDLLPRWVLFAVAGTVLLSVGATYERRRLDLERFSARLRDFH